MIYLTTLILTLFLTQIARALPQACDDPILPAWATQEEYGEELYEFMIPSPLRTTYDGTYDNKHGSLNSVACSNGQNGLVHVTGFENPPGSRVWVSRVRVRVHCKPPI